MRSSRFFLRVGVVLGAVMMGAPVVGAAGIAAAMKRAFDVLGSNGISDPKALSDSVATTLMLAASGIALFPTGLVLLIVCLLLLKRRRGGAPPPLPRFVDNISTVPKKD